MHPIPPPNTKSSKIKKTLRLLPVILKNFFPVVLGDLKDFLKRSRLARWVLAILILLILSFSGYRIWKYYHYDPDSPDLTLAQAGRIGEVTTHKLLVQIENRPCPGSDSGCYERGDIVLVKPGDWEFSDGEKEGFLILHMDITDKQAEVLVRSIEKKVASAPKPVEKQTESLPAEKAPRADARPTLGEMASTEKSEEPEDVPSTMETVKLRKYAVDLEKIRIKADEQKGREVSGQIYKWDIVLEKK